MDEPNNPEGRPNYLRGDECSRLLAALVRGDGGASPGDDSGDDNCAPVNARDGGDGCGQYGSHDGLRVLQNLVHWCLSVEP
jgi:hypothetical protein